MTRRVDLYDKTYGNFSDRVHAAIRAEAFGVDIGQNSWTTEDEYDRFIAWLGLTPGRHALEVASGSGGPAIHLARRTECRLTGIDANELGVAAATTMATEAGLADRVDFRVADANAALPFDSDSFDALLCIDSMNHFPDRLRVFQEWRRVLRLGGRAVFTDPVVITGPVTNDELALRSNIGLFLFAPPGVNERLIAEAGLRLVEQEDVTANAALVSGRWRDAREHHRDALLGLEGEERFTGLQAFFAMVHRLTRERRLSRVAYRVVKPEL